MFIFGLILLAVTLICAAIAVVAKLTKAGSDITVGWSAGAAVALVVTLIVMAVASYSPVGTQNIGVVTSFGRPDGELSNGVHWLAPWKSVTEIDGAIQTQTYEGTKRCVTVRIGEQQTACADVVLRWRIEPSAADELFRNYHGGGSVITDVSNSLVHPDFVSALNAALDTYNPVAATAAVPGSAANPHLAPDRPGSGDVTGRAATRPDRGAVGDDPAADLPGQRAVADQPGGPAGRPDDHRAGVGENRGSAGGGEQDPGRVGEQRPERAGGPVHERAGGAGEVRGGDPGRVQLLAGRQQRRRAGGRRQVT